MTPSDCKTLTTTRIYCCQLQPVTCKPSGSIRFPLRGIHVTADQQEGIPVNFKMPLSPIKRSYEEMCVQKRFLSWNKRGEVKKQNLTVTLTMTFHRASCITSNLQTEIIQLCKHQNSTVIAEFPVHLVSMHFCCVRKLGETKTKLYTMKRVR